VVHDKMFFSVPRVTCWCH